MVHVRCGVNDWDSFECPDCAPPIVNAWPPPPGRWPDGVKMIGGCLDGKIIKRPGGMYIVCMGHRERDGSFVCRHTWQWRFLPNGELVGASCTTHTDERDV